MWNLGEVYEMMGYILQKNYIPVFSFTQEFLTTEDEFYYKIFMDLREQLDGSTSITGRVLQH